MKVIMTVEENDQKQIELIRFAYFDDNNAANNFMKIEEKNEKLHCIDVQQWVNYPIESLKHVQTFQELIPSLDDRAIQKVLCDTDSQELAKSLKGEEQEVCDKIFRNMSKRASDMLKEDMEYMGPIRLTDIKESQRNIVQTIKRLEANGEIVIPNNDEMLVV